VRVCVCVCISRNSPFSKKYRVRKAYVSTHRGTETHSHTHTHKDTHTHTHTHTYTHTHTHIQETVDAAQVYQEAQEAKRVRQT
jgi:carbohydrate-binding DOMON domain-containing protein